MLLKFTAILYRSGSRKYTSKWKNGQPYSGKHILMTDH